MKRGLIAILSLLVLAVTAGVEDNSARAGRAALGFQNLGGFSPAVDLRIWVSDRLAVQPAIGIMISDNDETVTDINVGGRVLYTLWSTKQVDYHLSGDVGIRIKDNDKSLTDVGLRAMLGPEFFLTPHLSFQTDVGIGLWIYDSDGLDRTDFGTSGDLAGNLALHYYF